MKKFHIAYYLNRDVSLLGGYTVDAESIIYAIGKFLNDLEIEVDQIKYVVEL